MRTYSIAEIHALQDLGTIESIRGTFTQAEKRFTREGEKAFTVQTVTFSDGVHQILCKVWDQPELGSIIGRPVFVMATQTQRGLFGLQASNDDFKGKKPMQRVISIKKQAQFLDATTNQPMFHVAPSAPFTAFPSGQPPGMPLAPMAPLAQALAPASTYAPPAWAPPLATAPPSMGLAPLPQGVFPPPAAPSGVPQPAEPPLSLEMLPDFMNRHRLLWCYAWNTGFKVVQAIAKDQGVPVEAIPEGLVERIISSLYYAAKDRGFIAVMPVPVPVPTNQQPPQTQPPPQGEDDPGF